MDFNELIDKTHFDYEQNEAKARQLEERILKVPGMSKSYLPKRKYGENYKGDQLGVTASSLIPLVPICVNTGIILSLLTFFAVQQLNRQTMRLLHFLVQSLELL